jgi:hypothetical protein
MRGAGTDAEQGTLLVGRCNAALRRAEADPGMDAVEIYRLAFGGAALPSLWGSTLASHVSRSC